MKLALDTDVSEPGTTADPTPGTGGDWRAALPDAYEVHDDKGQVTGKINFRTDGTLAKYKSPIEAFRALIEAQKVIGQGVLKLPGPDAKPEERAAFYDRLGRPKDAAGYAEVKAADGIHPEGLAAYLQNVAVARRMDPADVQASVNFLAEFQARQQRDAVQAWDNAQEGVRTEWGLNFDRNHDMAQRYTAEVIAKAGGSETGQAQVAELFQLMDRLGLGHHPGFLRWMHFHAANATEDVFLPGAPDAAASGAALDAQIKAADAEFHKLQPGQRGYDEARQHRDALYKKRYGDGAVV
jgi:hypothetical protein